MSETLLEYIEESSNWKALASSLGLSLAALTGTSHGAETKTGTNAALIANRNNSNYLKTATEQIKKFEGFRDLVYKDTRNIPTIGYGVNLHALNDASGKALLAKYNLDLASLVSGKQKIDEKTASALLAIQIKKADAIARKYLPDFDNYPTAVKVALVDMAFNMGNGGLSTFKKLKAAIVQKNWTIAAKEIIDSKNYGKSPAKGLRRRASTNASNIANIT